MKSLHKIIALASIAALAGCGEDQPDETKPLPPYELAGGYGNDVQVVYDADNDQFTATSDGETITGVIARNPTLDQNGFKAYQSDDDFIFVQTSASGETAAGLAFHNFNETATYTGASGFAGAGYTREAGTVLPTSGAATFSGDYVGVLQHNAELYLDSYIVGDVTLNADFAAMTISGVIDNRANYDTSDGDSYDEVIQDVLLNETAITSTGTYSGTTSGGATDYLDEELSSNHDGVYLGAFGGATGGETAGAVQIDHDLTGLVGSEADEIYTEFGAFIASE